jgi:hypothetical protein
MYRLFSLFLLLFAARSALSQPLPDRRPLVGIAVDGAGKPVVGAFLSVRRQENNGRTTAFWSGATATDERGEFRFPNAETGTYYLNADVTGFAPIYNMPIRWKLNSPVLRVQFERLVDLRLNLVNPDGSPAANTPVWMRLRGDGYAGQTSRRETSDEKGQIWLKSVLPATYSLFLSCAKGYALNTRFALRTDSVQNLQLQSGGALKITVQDEGTPPKALGGAALTLNPENPEAAIKLMGEAGDVSDDFGFLSMMGERLSLVSREGDGLIDIPHLPPGRYEAKMLGAAFALEPARILTIEANKEKELVWTLVPKSSAKGSLTLQLNEADGKAASGDFAIRVLPIKEDGSLVTEEISPEAPGGNAGRRARADSSGRITLFPIASGRYRFFVNHFMPGMTADQLVTAASVDVMVPSGNATASLVLKKVP